jgi:hypothetical protein
MSLLSPNERYTRGDYVCHVCSRPIDRNDVAVTHDGTISITHLDFFIQGYAQLELHTECAVVLAMRLISDAMNCNTRTEKTPRRAVELLRRKEIKS